MIKFVIPNWDVEVELATDDPRAFANVSYRADDPVSITHAKARLANAEGLYGILLNPEFTSPLDMLVAMKNAFGLNNVGIPDQLLVETNELIGDGPRP